MGDAGEAVDQRQADREQHAGAEPEPGRAGHRRGRGGGEGSAQHLALEADVDHARALGEQAGERRQHERRREPDGRVGQQQELQEQIVHQATAPAGAGLANSASSHGRNMCSSAPANRITRPWITTTRSRLSAGMSNDSSEPP